MIFLWGGREGGFEPFARLSSPVVEIRVFVGLRCWIEDLHDAEEKRGLSASFWRLGGQGKVEGWGNNIPV